MLPTPTANTNTTTPKTQPSPIPIAYHAPEHISTLYCPLHSYSLHHHHYELIMSTTATCCSAAPTTTTPNLPPAIIVHTYLCLYGYAHVEHIPTLYCLLHSFLPYTLALGTYTSAHLQLINPTGGRSFQKNHTIWSAYISSVHNHCYHLLHIYASTWAEHIPTLYVNCTQSYSHQCHTSTLHLVSILLELEHMHLANSKHNKCSWVWVVGPYILRCLCLYLV